MSLETIIFLTILITFVVCYNIVHESNMKKIRKQRKETEEEYDV